MSPCAARERRSRGLRYSRTSRGGAGVRREKEEGFGFVLLIFQEHAADRGFVWDGLAADFDGVVGDRGLFFRRGRGGFGGGFRRPWPFFPAGKIWGGAHKKR